MQFKTKKEFLEHHDCGEVYLPYVRRCTCGKDECEGFAFNMDEPGYRHLLWIAMKTVDKHPSIYRHLTDWGDVDSVEDIGKSLEEKK